MTHPRRYRKLRSPYVWHRYAGVSVALIVLVLVTSGLLLNHGQDLRLDQRRVRWPWLLDLYGIQVPELRSYATPHHWVSALDERVYVDGRPLGGRHPGLVGAVEGQDFVALAFPRAVLLLTTEGEVIERLDASIGVPAGISAVGRREAGLVLRASGGGYAADATLSSWTPASTEGVAWSRTGHPPTAITARIARSYRGEGLPLERVLLDLHSGRLFGHAGVLVMDLAALALMGLAGSGLWMWLRGLARRRPVRMRGRPNTPPARPVAVARQGPSRHPVADLSPRP